MQKVGAREFAHLHTFAEDDDAAGKVHEFGQFGGDEQDGGALAGELIEGERKHRDNPNANWHNYFTTQRNYQPAEVEPFDDAGGIISIAGGTGDH